MQEIREIISNHLIETLLNQQCIKTCITDKTDTFTNVAVVGFTYRLTSYRDYYVNWNCMRYTRNE
ncbi:hypothetical protein [Bacillus weihaiensis]|uniref:hypothetical protein n=1 Tax=Bacillus weihaiensis TaxID=1547283 RepID=UPI002355A5C3|nr:hypothetical protein [Bacillus weihaiensis]